MSLKDHMNVLVNAEQFDEAKAKEAISVFVFSANWCPDCRFIEPFMPKLIEKYKDYSFYYVDRDEWISLAQEQMVMGIPSFIGVGKGKELGRFVSKLRKSEAEIDEFLASLQK